MESQVKIVEFSDKEVHISDIGSGKLNLRNMKIGSVWGCEKGLILRLEHIADASRDEVHYYFSADGKSFLKILSCEYEVKIKYLDKTIIIVDGYTLHYSQDGKKWHSVKYAFSIRDIFHNGYEFIFHCSQKNTFALAVAEELDGSFTKVNVNLDGFSKCDRLHFADNVFFVAQQNHLLRKEKRVDGVFWSFDMEIWQKLDDIHFQFFQGSIPQYKLSLGKRDDDQFIIWNFDQDQQEYYLGKNLFLSYNMLEEKELYQTSNAIEAGLEGLSPKRYPINYDSEMEYDVNDADIKSCVFRDDFVFLIWDDGNYAIKKVIVKNSLFNEKSTKNDIVKKYIEENKDLKNTLSKAQNDDATAFCKLGIWAEKKGFCNDYPDFRYALRFYQIAYELGSEQAKKYYEKLKNKISGFTSIIDSCTQVGGVCCDSVLREFGPEYFSLLVPVSCFYTAMLYENFDHSERLFIKYIRSENDIELCLGFWDANEKKVAKAAIHYAEKLADKKILWPLLGFIFMYLKAGDELLPEKDTWALVFTLQKHGCLEARSIATKFRKKYDNDFWEEIETNASVSALYLEPESAKEIYRSFIDDDNAFFPFFTSSGELDPEIAEYIDSELHDECESYPASTPNNIKKKQSKTFWDYLGDFAGHVVDDFMNRAIETAEQNNMDKKANELKGYRDKFNKWRNS